MLSMIELRKGGAAQVSQAKETDSKKKQTGVL